ncbi:MAG TPA: NUDIX hydrolase, partial [Candidatus Manganitrophaceae bacterium]|nr:NUDIX hydrolase [Candidatus Manganitrophaceae bacterium]
MPYTYAYPHLAVTTDIVVFTIRERRLKLLLIKRGGAPYKGKWALPGGFVEPEEDLEQSAMRELEEETGVSGVYLEQLYTFGKPRRDPRERVITV